MYNHLNIPNINPEYPCGEGHENAEHFFMMCTPCNNIAIILKRKNEIHCTFTLGVYMEYITKDCTLHGETRSTVVGCTGGWCCLLARGCTGSYRVATVGCTGSWCCLLTRGCKGSLGLLL